MPWGNAPVVGCDLADWADWADKVTKGGAADARPGDTAEVIVCDGRPPAAETLAAAGSLGGNEEGGVTFCAGKELRNGADRLKAGTPEDATAAGATDVDDCKGTRCRSADAEEPWPTDNPDPLAADALELGKAPVPSAEAADVAVTTRGAKLVPAASVATGLGTAEGDTKGAGRAAAMADANAELERNPVVDATGTGLVVAAAGVVSRAVSPLSPLGTVDGISTTSVKVGTKRGGALGGVGINQLSAPSRGV